MSGAHRAPIVIPSKRGTMSDTTRRYDDHAVIDRLHKLRVILPAMAQEAAAARQEAARLRRENAQLSRRLAELESADA
jgi:hypothetical protein